MRGAAGPGGPGARLTVSSEYPAAYLEFLRLYRAGEFYEAHEVLEHHWMRDRQDFFKALIQLAVAYYQFEVRGKRAGAAKLFARVRRYLARYAPEHLGLDVRRLLHEVEVAMDALARGEAPPRTILRGPAVEALSASEKSGTYPDAPRPSAHAVVTDPGGRVLLVRRGSEPFKGWWGLPGGALELGEPLLEGLKREVREETGLEVEPERFLLHKDAIHRDPDGRVRYHYLILFFTATLAGGTPGPAPPSAGAPDVADARWVSPDELSDLRLVPGAAEVLLSAGVPVRAGTARP